MHMKLPENPQIHESNTFLLLSTHLVPNTLHPVLLEWLLSEDIHAISSSLDAA